MALRTLLFLCACALMAGEPGVPAQSAGGTIPALQRGCKGRLQLAGEEAFEFTCRAARLRIPYDHIQTLEYGQHVHRRYMEGILISPVLLLSKSRRHFVTLGYTDEGGHRQALVLEVGKRDVRVVLAGLEAKSGRRIEYQDEESRHRAK